jgi:hypothetical protein
MSKTATFERVVDEGLGVSRLVKIIPRYDTNTGARIEDALEPVNLERTKAQRDALLVQVQALDEKIADAEAAIAKLGDEIIFLDVSPVVEIVAHEPLPEVQP